MVEVNRVGSMVENRTRAIDRYSRRNLRIIAWIVANVAITVVAAWGINQGSWPSALQILSLNALNAQLATSGFLGYISRNRIATFAAGIAFLLISWWLTEQFDTYHDSTLLAVPRFRHSAVVYCVGMITGWSWTRQNLNSAVRNHRVGAFSLKTLLLAVAGVGALLSLRAVCPNGYELFQKHGLLPMMPFYWPVSVCFGIAASIGIVATRSRATVRTRVVMVVLISIVLGLLPPFYYYGALPRATDLLWSVQMITAAAFAAIASISFIWACDTRAELSDATL